MKRFASEAVWNDGSL